MKNKYMLTLISISLIALLNFSYAEGKYELVEENTKSWSEIKLVLERNLKDTYGEMFKISNLNIKSISHKKDADKQIYKISASYELSYVFKEPSEFPYIKGASTELKKLDENSDLYKSLKEEINGRIKDAEGSIGKKFTRDENFVIEEQNSNFLVFIEQMSVKGDEKTKLVKLEEYKINIEKIQKAGREFVLKALTLENSDNSYKKDLHGLLSEDEFNAHSKAIKKELELNGYLELTSFVVRKLETIKDEDTKKDEILARISYKYKYKFKTKEDLPFFKGMSFVLSNLEKDSKQFKDLQSYISKTMNLYDLENFHKEDVSNLDVLIVKDDKSFKYFAYFDECKSCEKHKKPLSEFHDSSAKMFKDGKKIAEDFLKNADEKKKAAENKKTHKSSFTKRDKANVIVNANIMRPSSGAGFDDYLTRAQAVTLIIRLLGKEDDANALSKKDLEEVLSTVEDKDIIQDWARKYLAYAIRSGITNGVGSTSAGKIKLAPNDSTSSRVFITMLIRALGYSEVSLYNCLEKAAISGISSEDLDEIKDYSKIKRIDVADQIYNAISKSNLATNDGILPSNKSLRNSLIQKNIIDEEFAAENF